MQSLKTSQNQVGHGICVNNLYDAKRPWLGYRKFIRRSYERDLDDIV